MKKENKNLKLFPKYRRISRDFLFFYTINVLFLTQIKKIDISDVVLVDTFYSLFVVIAQVPATTLIEKIGRKKSMILGNFLNAIYLFLVINASNLFNLIIAEITCAMAFALKDVAEHAILNESITFEKEEKSKIFSKIQGKAISGYYILSAVSMIFSGFLYEINGYIPITISLIIVIIALIISTKFEEPPRVTKEEKIEDLNLKEIVEFVFKSNRCKSLLLFSAIFYGIFTVLATYEVSLLEELEVSSKYIGIIFALLNIVSAFSSGAEKIFQEKFKNRTLSVLGICLTLSCLFSGLASYCRIPIPVAVLIIIVLYMIKYMSVGLYNVLYIKYLSNFTNSKIDTKIFAINSFLGATFSIIFGVIASALVRFMPTNKSMVLFGALSFLIIIFTLKYMKKRVGLKPEEYSEIELKYDSRV